MPQFFLAVGLASRLTIVRRLAREGPRAAYGRAVARALGLLLVGFIVHHLDGRVKTWDELVRLGPGGVLRTAFQRNYFQTLVHIALTSLWVLPVIASAWPARLAWLVASAGAHLAISGWGGYYDWVMARPGIDGGPLGFLTWTTPLLVGSIASDLVVARPPRASIPSLLAIASALMAAGYALTSADGAADTPPFCPPAGAVGLWTMSQRSGSVTYLAFASGFGLAVYALFVLACDALGARVGLFRTFGRNALAAYILHPMVASAVKPYLPGDAPAWYAWGGFALYFGIVCVVIRSLEKEGIYLKA